MDSERILKGLGFKEKPDRHQHFVKKVCKRSMRAMLSIFYKLDFTVFFKHFWHAPDTFATVLTKFMSLYLYYSHAGFKGRFEFFCKTPEKIC